MNLISDEILIDSGQQTATYDPIYPMIDGFRFWDPAAWTQGHPYDAYRRMRQEAPVMWTKTDKNLSGFWSVTKYEDIKA
ncbi:MAG: cytochrome P450, partial [Gammaproteobacteria bacterium]|nr:cytochrome P450 [Gammaproteobacteria bacterium]